MLCNLKFDIIFMFFKRIFFITLTAIALILFVQSAGVVLAQQDGSDASAEMGKQLQAAAGAQGAALGTPVDPRVTIVFIIRVLLSLTTLVLIGLNIYAGFQWMTAGGNEEQVTGAKTTIRNATIGLIIVLSAYSITIFAANLARGYSTGGGGRSPVQNVFGALFK